ncbi:hypothetical protein BAUCODRAFT_37098 [Baudoinia panamericana UAMH 10762]|uniref:Fe2OG dioxygenase domain-containing protein n=1 Tax=Baudoinia panamericana (strain UAMH 10762) TaxID=717646 RepID=M2N362_BAUPA|nr:uncharacterized protein BAUCODRAFT_37098 [Baudoinia panamericana UAMH 10762]EMC93419.1 hypothetical protein BAUCODRAFT_37098 [Baudoinia panamericana UAMH 10762]
MSKRPRTLETFFAQPSKRARAVPDDAASNMERNTTASAVSNHPSYPFAVPHLPPELQELLNFAPSAEGQIINDRPDLDLLYYQPYVPKEASRDLSEFLRRELFFYRVGYKIKRGSIETDIDTPRFTTVFGIDETARFDADGRPVDATTGKATSNTYKCKPRPMPQCLDALRQLTENSTGCTFNFALVNYYASGNDSISYHSDDERFLGTEPAIASFTLGAKRDFLMKHKPTPANDASETKPMKLPLASGDMVLMRGLTQSRWLHSIPKRKGGEADKGRINITFRRAMVKGGTENYYHYNVGNGEVYKWDDSKREMVQWRNPLSN